MKIVTGRILTAAFAALLAALSTGNHRTPHIKHAEVEQPLPRIQTAAESGRRNITVFPGVGRVAIGKLAPISVTSGNPPV